MSTDERTIVIAEDDLEDQELFREAWDEAAPGRSLEFLRDGEALLRQLERDRPGVVILDLNLPVKDGRAALREMQRRSELRRIPVVVVSTSNAEEDVALVYELGGAGYFVKPRTFGDLCDLVATLDAYWLRHAQLPPTG